MLGTIKRFGTDAILDLVAKAVSSVVHEYHVFHLSVLDHSEIFDEDPFFGFNTAVAVHPCLDQLSVRIDEVKDSICVALVTGCETNDLEILIDCLQSLERIRSNIEPSIDHLAIWEMDSDDMINVLVFIVLNAVDKSLIEIKDHHLGLLRVIGRWKVYCSLVQITLRDFRKRLDEEESL